MATAEEAEKLRNYCKFLRRLISTSMCDCHYGWFFDRTGAAKVERVKLATRYVYIFRTDQDP